MKSFLRQKYYAIKAICRTLWKAWPVWVLIFCAIIPRWFPPLLDDTQDERLTRLGVLYEFLGIVVVAWGIGLKMEIGGRNLRDTIIAWFKELLGNIKYLIVGPRIVNISGHATSKVNANMKVDPLRAKFELPDVSLEDKVNHLEKAINDVKMLITQVETNARNKISDLEKKVDDNRSTMAQEMKQAHIEFKAALAGDYKWEFTGLFVTLLGMIYNSIPKDIIHLFNWWISL